MPFRLNMQSTRKTEYMRTLFSREHIIRTRVFSRASLLRLAFLRKRILLYSELKINQMSLAFNIKLVS